MEKQPNAGRAPKIRTGFRHSSIYTVGKYAILPISIFLAMKSLARREAMLDGSVYAPDGRDVMNSSFRNTRATDDPRQPIRLDEFATPV